MNDRYLYRAKRKKDGKWTTWNAVTGIHGLERIEDDTICQCTGLKDKNDKDIYEGDILRKSGYWDVRVEFERGQFCIKGADIVQYLNNTIDDSIRNFPVDEYEVIGNIFDNAELLEKQNNF